MNDSLAGRSGGKPDAIEGAAGVAAPEPRTMQFVVEQACPLVIPPASWKRADFENALPMIVWVKLGAPVKMQCGGTSYLIATHLPVRNAEGLVGQVRTVKGGPPAVCEHMGHLIE